MKILLVVVLTPCITLGRKGLDLQFPLLPPSDLNSGPGQDEVRRKHNHINDVRGGTSQRSDGEISSVVVVQPGVTVGMGMDKPQIVAEPKIMWVTAGGSENTADLWTNSTGTSLKTFLARHHMGANAESSSGNSSAEQFGIFAEELLITLEVLVSLSMYVLIGGTTASLIVQAFRCSRRQALLVNIFWPISLSLAVGLIITQLLQMRLCQQLKLVEDKESSKSHVNGSVAVSTAADLSSTQLNQIFDPRESVTPESLSKKLHLPQDKAERWCKWFAGGRSELNLSMVLKKSAELKNADGATICRILFEVYDEEETGTISQTLAADMLYNWCIGKYGAICDCDDLQGLITTLITHTKQNGDTQQSQITREEWLRLAEKFPELFDTRSISSVGYLRLLCKVRADDKTASISQL
jgi:hypothetical protein